MSDTAVNVYQQKHCQPGLKGSKPQKTLREEQMTTARDWSVAGTNQGAPRIAGSHLSQEKGRKCPPQSPQREYGPVDTLISNF